jgi:hypothetical protein
MNDGWIAGWSPKQFEAELGWQEQLQAVKEAEDAAKDKAPPPIKEDVNDR